MKYPADELIEMIEKARDLGVDSISIGSLVVTFESHEEPVREQAKQPANQNFFKTRKSKKRNRQPVPVDCTKPGHEIRPSKFHHGEFYCHGCHLERKAEQWEKYQR